MLLLYVRINTQHKAFDRESWLNGVIAKDGDAVATCETARDYPCGCKRFDCFHPADFSSEVDRKGRTI